MSGKEGKSVTATSVRVETELWKALRLESVRRGVSANEIVNEALREWMDRQRKRNQQTSNMHRGLAEQYRDEGLALEAEAAEERDMDVKRDLDRAAEEAYEKADYHRNQITE